MMARPKENLTQIKTKTTLADRCNNEKEHLKQGVIKQLQKDLEGLLDTETHSDLTIRAEGIDIKVHKFIIRARSQVIYDRLQDLSVSDDPCVLVMPSWLKHRVVLFIVRKLYFVETDPLDEAVDKQDEVLMDYLRSLLTQHDNTIISGKSTDRQTQHDNTIISVKSTDRQTQHDNMIISGKSTDRQTQHDNTIISGKSTDRQTQHDNTIISVKSTDQQNEHNNNDCHKNNCLVVVNGACVSDDIVCDSPESRLHTADMVSAETDDQHPSGDVSEPENTTEPDPHVSAESQSLKEQTGEGCPDGKENPEETDLVEGADLSEVQCSFSDIIKLSYGLSVPYEACNRVGEDLLKGFLQEIDTDCEIIVSDVHFKAHKCVLCARSSYFGAMLGGSWRETDVINMEGVTPNVIEQMLLYLYGGVVDIIACTVDELIMVADMYGLQGIYEVVTSFLKREYCHMFHKICSGCEERLPEALSISITFHIDPLRDRCTDWINRNMLKMWRSKYLAKQPQDVLDHCYQKAIHGLNINTAIDLLMNCENLNSNIPRISWSEPLLCNITNVLETVIKFISSNFISIIQSTSFNNLDKGLGYKISLLEDIFVKVIESLPFDNACEVYHCLSIKQSVITALEINPPSEDFINFINFLVENCERFLKKHVHQILQTKGWKMLSKDTQNKLLEGGSFVLLCNGPADAKDSRKPPAPKCEATGTKSLDRRERHMLGQLYTRKKYTPGNLSRRPNKKDPTAKTDKKQTLKNPMMTSNQGEGHCNGGEAAPSASPNNQEPSNMQVTGNDGLACMAVSNVQDSLSHVSNNGQEEHMGHPDDTRACHDVVLADLPQAKNVLVQLVPALEFTFHTPS